MEEQKDVVKFEMENGETFEMLILKEFDFEKQKYAILVNEEACNCDDDCDCEKAENHECECEKNLLILKIETDDKHNEKFVDIKDKEEFERVVKEAEKVMFE